MDGASISLRLPVTPMVEISRARNEIRRGHAYRDKSVLVHGVTNDEAEGRLAAWEAT